MNALAWTANQVVHMKPRRLWPSATASRRVLDDSEVRMILRMTKQEYLQSEIAAELGVNVSTIAKVLKQEREKANVK